ncbi:hypothetical protein [Cohnella kolymensis]|uniref:hypothetical protein n=1 Tax=Cohnella kolymensis TaxID=1590652 RepID=UPI000ADBA692|nr:hypothetical protein [Cohnella kolymensis]
MEKGKKYFHREGETDMTMRKRDPHIELAIKAVNNWPDWKKAVYQTQNPRIVQRNSVTR